MLACGACFSRTDRTALLSLFSLALFASVSWFAWFALLWLVCEDCTWLARLRSSLHSYGLCLVCLIWEDCACFSSTDRTALLSLFSFALFAFVAWFAWFGLLWLVCEDCTWLARLRSSLQSYGLCLVCLICEDCAWLARLQNSLRSCVGLRRRLLARSLVELANSRF